MKKTTSKAKKLAKTADGQVIIYHSLGHYTTFAKFLFSGDGLSAASIW
jgi:hypothetical protein